MRYSIKGVDMKKESWHVWFAWYPVTVNHKKVWLENVLRKGILRCRFYDACRWEYKYAEYDENPEIGIYL